MTSKPQPLFGDEELILAPMAEISHVALRMLIRHLGGCDRFYTEMLSAHRLVRTGPSNSLFMLRDEVETDLIYQLLGGEPDTMAEAASILHDVGANAVDINMGCSAPVVVKRNEGIALMNDPDRARQVTRAVRCAFPGHLSIKLRLGWDLDWPALQDFGRMLCDEGVDGVVLHPRLKQEKFKRRARWDWIARLGDVLPVPVVGNGDVKTLDDYRRLRHDGGCRAVMIGRGAVSRPWLFRDIRTGEETDPPRQPILRQFIDLVHHYLPPENRLSRIKIFTYWFSQSLFFGHTLYSAVQSSRSTEQAEAAIADFFARTDAS